jgi:membrane-bound serine protease (ClpP class)
MNAPAPLWRVPQGSLPPKRVRSFIRSLPVHLGLTLLWTLLLAAQSEKVFVVTIDGAINPASADYLHEELQRASEARAECLIVRLNTPGGLLVSTRAIVSDFLTSPIPVVVFVSPQGSQAASAGVFVTLAADLAVMAPGTNIGAAHPVTIGEQMDSIMAAKVTNDAAAFIRSISEKRNRNVRWAEDAVRHSLSITETEALRQHVIDTIAGSMQDLLEKIDGREIHSAGVTHLLHTRNATVIFVEKSLQQKLLDILSDPNIAYLFMMLGFYGLLFELYNPGAILPGIVGFISLVLAFYSLHTLPVNYAGLALILFGIVLFVVELKVPSHGLLTAGGIVSLVLGSIMLFRTDSALDLISISWQVILAVVFVTSAFFLFAIGMGVRAQRRKPVTGIQGIIGETGEAMTDLKPDGQIKVHGEIWNATSLDGVLKKGTPVKVAQVENLRLKIHKST